MTEEFKPAPVATAAPKAARKTTAPKVDADVFAFANAEMPEAFRAVAEKSVQGAKDAYAKMRSATEEATDLIEDQYELTRSGVMALSSKVLDATKTNVDATFQFAHEVMTVKTVAEAIELQSAFARRQFDLISGQAKDMQALIQKLATDAAQPAKDAFAKLADVKAA